MNAKVITVSKKVRREISQHFSSDFMHWESLGQMGSSRDGVSHRFTRFDGFCNIYIEKEECCKKPKIMFVWLHDKYEEVMLKTISNCLHYAKNREDVNL